MFAATLDDVVNGSLGELDQIIQKWTESLDAKNEPKYQPDSHTKPKETVEAKRDVAVDEARKLRQGKKGTTKDEAIVMSERLGNKLPSLTAKRNLERAMGSLLLMYDSTEKMKDHVKKYNATKERLLNPLIPEISSKAISFGQTPKAFLNSVLNPNSKNPNFIQLREKLAIIRGNPELASIRREIRIENYQFMKNNAILERSLVGIEGQHPELMERIRGRIDKRLQASIESIPDMEALDVLDVKPNGQPRLAMTLEADRAVEYMDKMIAKMGEQLAHQPSTLKGI
jgi:hypothetical protein